MLNFKDTQTGKPLFDYYVETDLDSFDDQPVDYSKKYSDQESYEECRRRKSSLKSNELPPEVSQNLKQSSSDEVKIYCIEGTPLTISYASSLSDLREIGTNCLLDKSDTKHSFVSVNDDGCTDLLDIDSKKDVELLHSNNQESPLSKDKEDAKEGKSVSFRNSTDISKASSPLMFSRSSSIGSLTSFEQQSIIDDRSSVSVFSALTSGLISPSDLPDSPGDLMSPTLTDKDNSPKIDIKNCSDDDDLVKKEEIHPKQTLLNDIQNEIAAENHLPETKIESRILGTSKSCEESEDDDDDELLQQCIQLGMPENKPNKIESSIPDTSKSYEESDDDDEELLQQCIQLGMPANKPNKIESRIPDASKSYEESDDDEELLQQCIQLGMPENKTNKILENQACAKSYDDCDADEILLQQCIELGMPKKSENVVSSLESKTVMYHPVNMKTNTSQYPFKDGSKSYQSPCSNINNTTPTSYQQYRMPSKVNYNVDMNHKLNIRQPSPVKRTLKNEFTSKSDDQSDDDILLQKCIELGMPSNPNEIKQDLKVSKKICSLHPQNVPASVNHYPFKDRSKSCQPSHSNTINIIPTSYQQYRNPSKLCYTVKMNHKTNIRLPSPAKKMPENVYRKPCATKSEADSDENELLLQRVIEMGMPKNLSEKKNLHCEVQSRSEFNTPQFGFHSSDMRDNCPDGISDGGDEEDAILEKCIRAGMPSPKLTHNSQNKLSYFHTKHLFQKQVATRPSMPVITPESSKKCNSIGLPPNQPYASVHSSGIWISNTSFIDVDSMRVYRTEDTPVLSPTASVSDLSSLSINESFLNNSRNSDCSSESEDDDDELLQQCIRSGMPEAKRAVA